MIPFHKSIGFRLLLISFILLALPLLVDSFILIRERYKHKIGDAKSFLIEIANFREIPLSQIQPLNRPLMELLTYYLKLEIDFPEKETQQLNESLKALAQVGGVYGIFLLRITPEGRYVVVASGQPQFIGKDFTDFFKLYDLYSPASIERGYTNYISFDNQTLHPYFIGAHAIFSETEGRYVGILAISQDITFKMSELLTSVDNPYRVNFALMLPSTIVFAASDPSLKFKYFLQLEKDYLKLFQKEQPSAASKLASEPIPTKNDINQPFFEFMWNGEAQIGYIRKTPDTNYSLLTYAAKKDVFQAPLVNFLNIFTVYGIILIVGGILSTLLTMRMAKPIQNLSHVMQKIQAGNPNVRYQKDSFGFEINHLGNIFNEMVDAVLEQKHIAEEDRVKRETLASELRLGQQVQRSLLPQRMPKYPGVEIAQIYIPAIEVGGDFFDVFVKQIDKASLLAIAVADASGKGVQACFYSLSVRTILRTYIQNFENIANAMGATNDLFCKDTDETGMFVTVLAGLYDYKTRRFSYYSCGHNPGYVKRADGSLETLQNAGMAMGVFPTKKEVYASEIQLNVGDIIIFYTDGISEASNNSDQFFGTEKLEGVIAEAQENTAGGFVEEIIGKVSDFVGDAPQHDDITLLAVKIIE